MKLKSINPYNNDVISEFDEFNDKEIEQVLVSSRKTFTSWKNTGFDERAKLMRNVASLLRKDTLKYARTITMEMGKTIKEAKAEVEKCAWVCEYYADNAKIMLHREAVATDADLSYIRYDPIGPVLGIMPWNFPFWQVFRFAAPTVMAGNTVLLKHASNVQNCAKDIEFIFREAGFPEGVFSNLVISSSKVKQVIENNIVKAITLTGSDAAGSNVAETAGRNIKKTVLELGGSNAFIVLGDADLNEAAKTGVRARMMNGGQSCIAAKRFILLETIAQPFIQLLQSNITALKTGDPLEEETDIGPLATVQQAKLLEDQVKRSVAAGAEILTGGNRRGAFFDPTILTDVKPGMPVFDEEVFGPVAPIIIVKTEEEAIELSNTSSYGLGATVFTNSIEKADYFVNRIEDGSVFINEFVKSDPRLPFGGTKRSGYGRELSLNGIREFVNVKTVFMKHYGEMKQTNAKNNTEVDISVGS